MSFIQGAWSFSLFFLFILMLSSFIFDSIRAGAPETDSNFRRILQSDQSTTSDKEQSEFSDDSSVRSLPRWFLTKEFLRNEGVYLASAGKPLSSKDKQT